MKLFYVHLAAATLVRLDPNATEWTFPSNFSVEDANVTACAGGGGGSRYCNGSCPALIFFF